MTKDNIDYSALSPELQARLLEVEKNSPAGKQLRELEKLYNVLKLSLDALNQLNQQDLDGNEQTITLLSEIQNALEALNSKEAPEVPDYATPVVDTLKSFEKAVTQALKKIDIKPQFKPEINVAAPNVDVAAPKVDLKGLEKILKSDIPKSFGEAIAKIPVPEKPDNTPFFDFFDKISNQLESIDTATRMKASGGGDASAANQVTANTSLGNIETDTDYRFGGGKTAYTATIAASGNTNLLTPSSGNRIQLYWLSFIPNSDNVSANLVKIGFGTTGGSISTELYRAYAMAHWELFTGTANQSLIINTASNEPVAVTVHYKEVS